MSYPYTGIQHRPAVTGRRGMVSSAHALASLAGLRTLMEGGNAIDAAVAVASCLGATEIGLSGIGGVGWMQIYHAKTKTHTCLDYQGWSPYAADRSLYEGPEQLMTGCARRWCRVRRRAGAPRWNASARWTAPVSSNTSSRSARTGHPLTVHATQASSAAPRRSLRQYPSSVDFFFPDGQPPRPGQPPQAARPRRAPSGRWSKAARTRTIKGEIADKIVNFCQANGGLITKRDLADLTVEWVEPIGIPLPRLHGLRPAAAIERGAVDADAQAAGGCRPGRRWATTRWTTCTR